mgnify:CR=1 FL=1
MPKRNAFIIEGPVPPELFFDRKEIIDYFSNLLRLEKYKMLIAIVAPFKFGKTSTLFKLYEIAKKNDKVIPILIRLNVVSKPINYIIRSIKEIFPNDIVVDQMISEGEPYFIFREINRVLEKEDKWLILFVDEFQELASLVKSEGYFKDKKDSFIYEFFRGIVEEFRIGLVVSGSVIGPLLDALDIWHGRFIVFKLRKFPREDSIKMLKRLFELSGMDVSDDIIEYIAIAMNDHPFHMQLFGHYLVNIGRTDEQAIEEARKKVMSLLIDYYEAKLREVKRIGEKALELLRRAIDGVSFTNLSDDEIDLAFVLERKGFIYRENGEYRIADEMFGRFIINLISGRPKEKYIPEYSSEYIVAKHLAYKEGFKSVFISLMSWGPFDIVIMKPFNNFKGIGIQVKRAYSETIVLDNKEIANIKFEANKVGLLPVLALVIMPSKRIRFYSIDLKHSADRLSDLIKIVMRLYA